VSSARIKSGTKKEVYEYGSFKSARNITAKSRNKGFDDTKSNASNTSFSSQTSVNSNSRLKAPTRNSCANPE
jgi:hypothetical protein